MKKFLLLCLLMIGITVSSQIFVNEGFEDATTPPGWTYTGFARNTTTGFPCTGSAALRRSYTSSNSEGNAIYASTASNGNAIDVSFSYSASPNTAGGNFDGFMLVDYSVDGGLNWSLLGSFITFSNTEVSCAPFTATIPSGSVPVDANFQLRVSGTNSGGTSWYMTIDDVSIVQTASCYQPTNVVATTTGSQTANITWDPAQIVPANGYQIYYSTSDVPPTSSASPQVTGATSPAPLSGLTPATQYYVWVRSACSASDISAWSIGDSFITDCVPFNVPYFENFDTTPTGSSSNNNAPICWSYLETSGSAGYGYVSATNHYSSPTNFYMYNSSTTSGDMMLVSPQTTNLTDGTNRVRFHARGGSTTGDELEVGILTNPTDPATFTIIGTTLSLTNVHTEYIVDIPAGTGEYLAFRHGMAATYDAIYIDDVYVENQPTCLRPSDVIVTFLNQNSVTVSWTASTSTPANGYEVYVSDVNVLPAPTATPSTSVGAGITSATVGGLTAGTQYYVWVRAVCSSTDSSFWQEGQSFVTTCAPYTVPYSENFDTTATGSSTNNNAPTCWRYLETLGSAGYGYVSATNENSAPNNYYLNNSSDITGDVMLVSPETTNLSNGLNRVRFFARGSSAGYLLEVGTLSNPADPTTFTIIGSPITLTNAHTEYIVDIPTGTNNFVVFRNGMDTTSDIVYIDDIFIENIPSCVKPSDVMVPFAGFDSANISWTPSTSAPANGYEIYVSTTNTPPVTTSTPNATAPAGSTSGTVGSLSPNTTYYVWVRAVCSATDQSLWEPGGSFLTACAPSAVPFLESFSGGALPTCWIAVNPTTTSTSTAVQWKFSGATDYGTSLNTRPDGTFAWVDASSPYAGEHTVQLISPLINLTGLTSPYIQFEWFKNHSTNDSGTGVSTYDDNELSLEVNDGTGWVEIFSDTSNANIWRTVGIALPASYVGATIQLRFNVDKDVLGNGYFYDDVLLDEVQVMEAPACLMPASASTSNVFAVSAQVDWVAPTNAPSNGYQIYYTTLSNPPDASTTPSASVAAGITTYTMQSLNPETTYYVWIRSNCGANGFSDWISGGSFTTLSFCPTITFPTDNTANVPVSPTITWDTMPGATGYTITLGTTSGGTDILNALDVGNVTSYPLTTPLNNGTVYYLQINAYNGTTTSLACAINDFITVCSTYNVPYSENFDTTPTGSSTNNNAPACWAYLETSGSAGYGYVSASAANVNSAPNAFYMYNSSDVTGNMMLVSPNTNNLMNGLNRIRFSAKGTTAGYPIEVGTLSNPTDPTTFTIIGSPIIMTNAHQEYIVNIPSGTNTYVAIRHGMNSTTDAVYIDDVFVEVMPTCIEPTDVTISSSTITENGAEITWTPSITPPATYEIYYSTTNTPPTTPNITGIPGTATSYSLGSLSPSTTYYVWVRSNCSASDQSIWTDVESFTTLCDAPAILSVQGDTICGASGTADLSATADAGATINWYDVQTGGASLATGNTYTTPTISSTTTYYVGANSGSFTSGNVGPINPSALGTISSSNYAIGTYYQIFDVIAPTTLVSIDVFPVSSVSIGTSSAIEIRDNTGTTLVSVPYTVAVNDGVTPQTVTLNFPLSVGTGYRIGQGVGINLNRNTSGAVYPYTSSAINVTGNNFSSGPTYWYYIYNWVFSTGCESPRTPVVATVDPTCLGTSEVDKDSFNIYPNPFSDVVYIDNIREVKSLSVVDMAGRLIKKLDDPQAEIRLGDLQQGMYVFIIEMKDGTKKTVKAIKR